MAGGLLLEEVGHVAHLLVQVEVDALDGQLAGLDLREVEQVVDDRQQRFGIGLAAQDLLARVVPERRVAQREAQHADHAGQRGAHLVAHIGQELGLLARRILGALLGLAQDFLVLLQRAVGARQLVALVASAPLLLAQFLRLLLEHAVLLLHLLGARAHLVFQPLLVAAQAGQAHAQPPVDGAAHQQDHGDPGPRRAPRRRLDGQRQRRHVLAPDVVLVGRAHPEHIGPGIEVGIGGEALVGAGVHPALVEAVQPVGELVAFGRGEVQRREFEGEHGGVGRQGHGAGVLDRPRQQAREGLLERPVEDLQAGDHGTRRDAVVADRARIEGGDAVEAAEIQGPVARAQHRGVEEGAFGDAVGRRVAAPAPVGRVEARDAARGAGPDAAVLVFQDRRHRIVDQAVARGVAGEAERAVAPRHHAVQAHRGADPDVAAAVFHQVVHLVVADAVRVVGIVAEVAEPAAGAVQQVEAGEGADPEAAAPVFEHRPRDVVRQAGELRRIVAVAGHRARDRVEPVHTAAGRDPDHAGAVEQHRAHVVGVGVARQHLAPEPARRGVEGGDAGAAADPQQAGAVAHDGRRWHVDQAVRVVLAVAEHLGLAGARIEVVQGGGRTDPQPLPVFEQCAHLVVRQRVGHAGARIEAREAAAAQVDARDAAIPGAGPEGADPVAVQGRDVVVDQAVAVGHDVAEGVEALAPGAPAQQAVFMGAGPHRAVGILVQRGDPGFPDAVGGPEAAQPARIRATQFAPFQPAEAPDPEPLPGVDQQRVHRP